MKFHGKLFELIGRKQIKTLYEFSSRLSEEGLVGDARLQEAQDLRNSSNVNVEVDNEIVENLDANLVGGV